MTGALVATVRSNEWRGERVMRTAVVLGVLLLGAAMASLGRAEGAQIAITDPPAQTYVTKPSVVAVRGWWFFTDDWYAYRRVVRCTSQDPYQETTIQDTNFWWTRPEEQPNGTGEVWEAEWTVSAGDPVGLWQIKATSYYYTAYWDEEKQEIVAVLHYGADATRGVIVQ